MKKKTFKWLSLSLVFLLTILSCRKEKLAKMNKGKYEMIHIRSLSNGQKDTFQLKVNGPKEEDHSYFFKPIENKNLGYAEIYKIPKKSKSKKYQQIKVYLNDSLIPYFGYFYGKIDSYELTKQNLMIHYTEIENHFSGSIQFIYLE
jgi:hypothetical protein